MVTRIPFTGHADLEPTRKRGMNVIIHCKLPSPIRRMDTPGRRITPLQGSMQRLQAQAAVDLTRQSVANGLTGKEIQPTAR
jgi:hypothetical protein